jgi:lysophospholipase L1-like esterase
MKKILLLLIIMITSCTNLTKVVFLGDSITQQGENSEGEGTYKGFITLLRENVNQEVELINKGIGGNKVSDLLLRYNDDVLKLKPNIVFIYIGINDVWHKYDWGTGSDIDIYEKGLRKIITDIKAVGAKIILCTPTVIGENSGEFKLNNNFKDIDKMEIMNKDLDAFSDVVRNLSSEFNTDLLDLRKKFKEYISENNDQNMPKGVLTSDGVHLNNEGNKLIADEMIKYLN